MPCYSDGTLTICVPGGFTYRAMIRCRQCPPWRSRHLMTSYEWYDPTVQHRPTHAEWQAAGTRRQAREWIMKRIEAYS